MIGALFGFLISLVILLAAGATGNDWWWLLWGTLIGLVAEVAVRLGFGEEFSDAVGNTVTALDVLGGIDGGGGDSGGDGGD
jgi:hypothetical protein